MFNAFGGRIPSDRARDAQELATSVDEMNRASADLTSSVSGVSENDAVGVRSRLIVLQGRPRLQG
jgi:hypothetical protein